MVPSWATRRPKVTINGKLLSVDSKPLSYLTLERKWRDGDQIEVSFDYEFKVKTTPDNPHRIALYYGPVLLAFETEKEIILEGDGTDILHSIKKQGDKLVFTLRNGGTDYILRPFYEVKDASYGVYAILRKAE